MSARVVQTIAIASLNSDPTIYMPVLQTCRLADAVSVIYTAITTNPVTVTFSDGTTTIGTLTIAAGAAGVCDTFSVDSTSEGKVELDRDTPLKIVCSGTPGAGAIILACGFDLFHADN